jgi:hypothetical protein
MSGTRITLDDRDVADVQVQLIKMVRVTGRLVPGPKSRNLVPSTITVSAAPLVSEGPAGPQRPGTVRADLTFEFRTWPGHGIVRISTPRAAAPGADRVSAIIRLNGVDVTKTGIDFQEGRNIAGLVVELP